MLKLNICKFLNKAAALASWAKMAFGPRWKIRTFTIMLLRHMPLPIRLIEELVTSMRIELILPGWKPGVLTVRRRGHGSSDKVRTCNPSVNSRMLYHWATEDYGASGENQTLVSSLEGTHLIIGRHSQMAELKRLELSTFSVTVRRSNQLSYNSLWWQRSELNWL